MISQNVILGGKRIEEKIIEARTVAYTQFLGVSDVGRRIWMVRDWILSQGIPITGYPSCIFMHPESMVIEKCMCEVQWEIPFTACPDSGNALRWQVCGNATTGQINQVLASGINGKVKTKRIEPELVLSTVHKGDIENIDQTILLLEQALKEAGYQKTNIHREIYLYDVYLPKSMWVTEIQVPVRYDCQL